MESNENKKAIKGIYTGVIAKDENNNFYCGEYLLDYQMTMANFAVGDEITIRSTIVNPSDKTFKDYPKKSKNFVAVKGIDESIRD